MFSIRIPGVELERELGHGAHSVVYRARQGDRACAVKVPRKKARWSRWVYREAVALARVHHPGLPSVIEVGETDDLPFLVMELVEGETLADRLCSGPLDLVAALDLGLHIASTLEAVHGAGLVHRDIKPRNIVVETGGSVRLVDFGFATPMERSADAAGTPRYAAPEQLRIPSRVDARTDLFGLGRVLLECLTGRPDADLADLQPGVRTILEGLLAEDPARRYPDAYALRSDLQVLRASGTPRGASFHERTPAPAATGREDVRDLVARAWSRVGQGGAVFFVRGARGAGKTTLLGACAGDAKRRGARHVALQGHLGDPPLAGLRRFVGALLAIVARSAEERAKGEEAIRVAVGDSLGGVARLVHPSLAEIVGVGGTPPPHSAFQEAVLELLVRFGQGLGPLFVTIDDAQWIDPASRDVFARLAHRVKETPIVVLLASRPVEAQGSESAWTGILERGHATTVALRALSHAEAADMIGRHLGAKAPDGLTDRVMMLADGTPLGVLEVLGALLDAGALQPHAGAWRLDVQRADHVVLPQGALAMLGRRISDLPPATREVLEVASAIGTRFEDSTLAQAVGIDPGDLDFALADARRAGVVENRAGGVHGFVHDSLREELFGRLPDDRRRKIHQTLAEVLDAGAGTPDDLYATALHYAAGELDKARGQAFRAARAAAQVALDRFDNETALQFFQLAADAAERAGESLDSSFYRSAGEARVRLGAMEAGREAFRRGLRLARDGGERAALLERIAWTHQVAAEPQPAWAALGDAFAAIGSRLPVEGVASVVETVGGVARARLRKLTGRTAPGGRHAELLCDLHYLNVRLATEYGKPLRVLESALEGLHMSESLPPSPAKEKAIATHGFVQTSLGRRAAGAADLNQARSMAEARGDRASVASCLQLQALSACFSGDFDQALVHLRSCTGEYGPWLDLSEYCQNSASGELIASLRGHARQALDWISPAVERMKRNRGSGKALLPFILHRTRAALAALGRPVDDLWLAAQLTEAARTEASAAPSFDRLASWGPRARVLLDTDQLGAPLDELVRAFRAEGHNPRFVHPLVVDFYIGLAHVRIQQCLRAPRGARPIAELSAALSDLRASAKLPLFRAHRLMAEGYLAWFKGDPKGARKAFAEAESLAGEQACSWVLYGVARGRAHMLREEGKMEAALDQARMAELLAREHGAEPRARWVREEFGLAPPVKPAATGLSSTSLAGASVSGRSSSGSRRLLAALLQVMRRPQGETTPDEQAEAIVDELLQVASAARGVLRFRPDSTRSALTVGRSLRGAWPEAVTTRSSLLDDVERSSEAWPRESGPTPEVPGIVDARRVVAVPLFLHERVVGSLCLERDANMPAFSSDDRALVHVLSHQVPVALEVARLLAERDELRASLQHAQKMEAVGQLAGGVAHDFNNMLAAIRASLDALGDDVIRDREAAEGVQIISEATARATELTKQLLTFSRHKPLPLGTYDVNQLIQELTPMTRRLAGERVNVVTKLGDVARAKTDPGSFGQVLVNLVVNGRDAMPGGGTLTIATHDALLDEADVRRGAPSVGAYVVVEVTDTGQGMTPETLARAFDPFFTTKSTGLGTGLGLTMVYALTKNWGGFVDVASEPGCGTTFRLHLACGEGVSFAPSGERADAPGAGGESGEQGKREQPIATLLLVDDDRLVRQSMARALERGGFRVLTADGGAAALEVLGERATEIALIVLDVTMPGMSGPELVRTLQRRGVSTKVLYVSGFSAENLVASGELPVDPRSVIQKPFSSAELVQRVRDALAR